MELIAITGLDSGRKIDLLKAFSTRVSISATGILDLRPKRGAVVIEIQQGKCRSAGAASSAWRSLAQPVLPAQSRAMHAGRNPHPTRREVRRSEVGQAQTPSNQVYT